MKSTLFKVWLYGMFGVGILLAVLIFSGIIKIPGFKKNTSNFTGDVVLWGTVDSQKINPILDSFNKTVKTYRISYEQKSETTYEQDLVEALASQKGPDIIILDPGLMVKHADKLYPTSFKTISERDYKDTYVDAASSYLSPSGSLAAPISVDPLVLYYNKDILSAANISLAPKYWNDLVSLAPILSQVNQNGTIMKSMVALGEFDNVLHAKDIIALLALQLGNPIVQPVLKYDTKNTPYFEYTVTFADPNQDGVRVGESAMRFYTEFSDPSKETYSWNKSFGDSKSMFLAGKTALYIGYASEYSEIQNKNPNLNFDITTIPQIKDATFKATYGKVLALGVLKTSKNSGAAFNAVDLLSSKDFAGIVADALGTAPARRDLLSEKQEDAYKGIVYPSALITRSWFDPNSQKTDELFKRMTSSIVSGKLTIGEAVSDFVADLKDVLP